MNSKEFINIFKKKKIIIAFYQSTYILIILCFFIYTKCTECVLNYLSFVINGKCAYGDMNVVTTYCRTALRNAKTAEQVNLTQISI